MAKLSEENGTARIHSMSLRPHDSVNEPAVLMSRYNCDLVGGEELTQTQTQADTEFSSSGALLIVCRTNPQLQTLTMTRPRTGAQRTVRTSRGSVASSSALLGHGMLLALPSCLGTRARTSGLGRQRV